MPQMNFWFYADKGNVAPVVKWLDAQPDRVQEKMIAAMRLLSIRGYESRRPLWAPLRDGIYEMRVQHENTHYRILCFFHGNRAIVAAHGCTKEAKVDYADIERAICRMSRFLKDPKTHTYREMAKSPEKQR